MPSKSPYEVFEATVCHGEIKSACPHKSSLGLTFLAGAYIALGGFLAIRVGGSLDFGIWGSLSKLIFAGVFPIGLMLVVLCGGDLFTGNCMTLTASCYRTKISMWEVVRGWMFSWGGNFLGSLFVAYCMAYLSGLIFDTVMVNNEVKMVWAESVVKITNAKCSLGWMEAFWRAVGCNWFVCIAVYAATAAKDVTGKIIALWIPTAAFVALGMEHCVANMFFVPLGILTGTDVRYTGPELQATWTNFLIDNMIPVTLGNIAGGAIMVAGIYAFIYRYKKS